MQTSIEDCLFWDMTEEVAFFAIVMMHGYIRWVECPSARVLAIMLGMLLSIELN